MPGFTGEGYIVFDPITGAGAYKITGGGNGGFLIGWSLGVLFAVSLVAFATTVTGLLAPALLSVIAMASLGYTFVQLQETDDATAVACFNLGFTIGISMVLNQMIPGFGMAMTALLGTNVMLNSIRNFQACTGISLKP